MPPGFAARGLGGCSGIVTLMGAITYGELAQCSRAAGGQYVYLREGISPLFGYLYGWTLFVVIQTGTIAAVAVAFARFTSVFWPGLSPDVFPRVHHALPATDRRHRGRPLAAAHPRRPVRRPAHVDQRPRVRTAALIQTSLTPSRPVRSRC